MFFRDSRYAKKVINRVYTLLSEFLDGTDRVECAVFFRTFDEFAGENLQIDAKAICKAYRKHGLSIDDAALSYIDGTVSAIKKLPSYGSKKPLNKAVEQLETVIDGVMLKRPGRIAPRNGRFGDAMEDPTLSKYLKTMPIPKKLAGV